MKNLIIIFLSMVSIIFFVRLINNERMKIESFNNKESLIIKTNECIESFDWKCAEIGVKKLLQESPQDKNLQLHLANILFEQERYEECQKYIATLDYSNKDLKYLSEKSALLIRELNELGIEKSMHFRVEFEGTLSKTDIMEALSVLEVAYDSLSRLFDYRPENKLNLVLYDSHDFQGVGNRPDWVGAIFDGKLRVHVKMMKYREVYRPMLIHELTHAFVNSMAKKNIPIWINEGIAQLVDGSSSFGNKPKGDVPSIESLTQPFIEENQRDKAEKLYWYSLKMVETIFKIQENKKANTKDFIQFRLFIQSIKELGVDNALKRYYFTTLKDLWETLK